ncbi:MAG: GAF domain-containing protein [Flavobacteriaceae bacterium]|nr:GAF domain-containing protein [Flavobacteriaceae bacterium]
MTFDALKPHVSSIVKNEDLNVFEKLQSICSLLHKNLDAYDWVGFYFANYEAQTLHLSAYVGEPTDHLTIPFGKGICGQVAESNNNFVVPDVMAQDNYIACSITVKAEIVVPLFVEGKNIGQIDIDSKTIDPFNEDDERFLEFVNSEVATLMNGVDINDILLT